MPRPHLTPVRWHKPQASLGPTGPALDHPKPAASSPGSCLAQWLSINPRAPQAWQPAVPGCGPFHQQPVASAGGRAWQPTGQGRVPCISMPTACPTTTGGPTQPPWDTLIAYKGCALLVRTTCLPHKSTSPKFGWKCKQGNFHSTVSHLFNRNHAGQKGVAQYSQSDKKRNLNQHSPPIKALVDV